MQNITMDDSSGGGGGATAAYDDALGIPHDNIVCASISMLRATIITNDVYYIVPFCRSHDSKAYSM